MENSFAKRYAFKALISTSLILGIIFFYWNHIEFISRAFEYGKMNLSNLFYALLRIVGGLIIPSMFEYGRIRLAKISFVTYGICHILTSCWIVYFLFAQIEGDFTLAQKITKFFVDGGYVYQLTFWDTYSMISVLFAVIYGIAAIYTGMNFDKDKFNVKWSVAILLILRLLLPLLNNLIFQGRVFSLFWITNNYLELAAQLCFTFAIFIAASDNTSWIEFVWDQMVFAEHENDELDD